MAKLYFVFILLAFTSCKRFLDASVPDIHWNLFDSSAAVSLQPSIQKKIEGVYRVTGQDDDFGGEAALKWTYVIDGKDTAYYLSIFCEEDVRYFICQGKRLDSTILLNGYWRNVENTKTGKAHLTITSFNGAMRLFEDSAFKPSDGIMITGTVGMFDEEPQKEFGLKYLRPLYNKTPLEIVAHRGGGRNSDLLPASENSIELIKLATRYGATGVELDVKLTKDSVPVLYHDANINDRLTNKIGVHPPIEKYTYAELMADIRLKKGEKIPTLREALETVLYSTPLQFVWLDTKNKDVMPQLRQMQVEFLQRADSMHRKLEITIGLPDDEITEKFKQIPDYKNVPAVSELSFEKTIEINAKIWAQGWVKGLQNEEVEKMQSMGKRAFVWTIDAPRFIRYFMKKGKFNGFVTNRPSIIAYYYFAKK